MPSSSVEALSPDELRESIRRGGRCVRFERCTSFFVATFRQQSRIYLTENWQDRYLRGLGFSLLALLLGPWGVPWGLYFTVRAMWTNLTGGIDVTDEVLAGLEQHHE
jgi:hypothetical protein